MTLSSSLVVQYNKRDLPGAMPVEELRALECDWSPDLKLLQ